MVMAEPVTKPASGRLGRSTQHRSHPWRDARRSPHRYLATRRRRWQLWRSWDEQQLAGGLAALHVGMGLRRARQPILAADPDLELAVCDPIEELRRMCAQQFGRMDKVEVPRIADLDALRQAHDVERSRSSKDRAIPAERA